MPEEDLVFTWWGSQSDTHVRQLDIGQIPELTGVPTCYFDREAILVHFEDIQDSEEE